MTAGHVLAEGLWSLSDVSYLTAALALSLLSYGGILGVYFV